MGERQVRWGLVCAGLLMAAACDDGAAPVDAWIDAATLDAQPADQAIPDGEAQDSRPPADAQGPDGSARDASVADAAPRDQAPPDQAPVDMAEADLGEPDQAPLDMGSADLGEPDMAGDCRRTVVVAGWEVFAYEASRADATADGHGAGDEACSQPGVLPWVTVTQADAHAACEAVGFELCTGAAWERICAGEPGSVDYRAFPYGNAHAGGVCNDHVSGGGALEPTGARPGCVTPEGVFDLSGNVWERVAEPDGRRGASWRPDAVNFRVDAARCDRQVFVGAGFAVDDLGFRCCRPAD